MDGYRKLEHIVSFFQKSSRSCGMFAMKLLYFEVLEGVFRLRINESSIWRTNCPFNHAVFFIVQRSGESTYSLASAQELRIHLIKLYESIDILRWVSLLMFAINCIYCLSPTFILYSYCLIAYIVHNSILPLIFNAFNIL